MPQGHLLQHRMAISMTHRVEEPLGDRGKAMLRHKWAGSTGIIRPYKNMCSEKNIYVTTN